MQPGTEIGDEILKYQEFSGRNFIYIIFNSQKENIFISNQSRFYQALIVEYNVKFLREKSTNSDILLCKY